METKHSVFIATSLDGFIADKKGGLDWLHSVPNPDGIDMGYSDFTSKIDALVMGRNTFETVCGFGIDWPYKQHVYVWSTTLEYIPENLQNQVSLVKGNLNQMLEQIHSKGHYKLYIDGGRTIQSFLKEDCIDELIISIIPKLLGGGVPLFSDLPEILDFECTESKMYPNRIVQNTFTRKR